MSLPFSYMRAFDLPTLNTPLLPPAPPLMRRDIHQMKKKKNISGSRLSRMLKKLPLDLFS